MENNLRATVEDANIHIDLYINEELFQLEGNSETAKQLIDAGYAKSIGGLQIIQIPTSPQVAEKIQNLTLTKSLWPASMRLVSVEDMGHGSVMVTIEWRRGKLSDIFFLGYWANHKSEL